MRLATILLISFFCFTELSYGQDKTIGIRIVQDDSAYTPEKGNMVIHLKKKSFRIQVLLQNLRGVYSFASTKDSLDKLPDEEPVPGFADLNDRLVVEEEYNKEKELQVEDNGWCYWSCVPDSTVSGFNKKYVVLDSGRVVGIKSVKQLYFTSSRHAIKLKDVRSPIYLFFVAVDESDPHGHPVHELLRRKVKIEWIEDD
jgi:hypothetical protein